MASNWVLSILYTGHEVLMRIYLVAFPPHGRSTGPASGPSIVLHNSLRFLLCTLYVCEWNSLVVSLLFGLWVIWVGFGPSRLTTLLDDWWLYLPLPCPRNVVDLLHGLKLLLPEVVPCSLVWPHWKKIQLCVPCVYPAENACSIYLSR